MHAMKMGNMLKSSMVRLMSRLHHAIPLRASYKHKLLDVLYSHVGDWFADSVHYRAWLATKQHPDTEKLDWPSWATIADENKPVLLVVDRYPPQPDRR